MTMLETKETSRPGCWLCNPPPGPRLCVGLDSHMAEFSHFVDALAFATGLLADSKVEVIKSRTRRRWEVTWEMWAEWVE